MQVCIDATCFFFLHYINLTFKLSVDRLIRERCIDRPGRQTDNGWMDMLFYRDQRSVSVTKWSKLQMLLTIIIQILGHINVL